MKTNIYNMSGEKAGDMELNEAVFNYAWNEIGRAHV